MVTIELRSLNRFTVAVSPFNLSYIVHTNIIACTHVPPRSRRTRPSRTPPPLSHPHPHPDLLRPRDNPPPSTSSSARGMSRGHAKNLLSSAGDVTLRRPRTLHRPTRSVRGRSLWNPSLPALLPITSRALPRHLCANIISALAHTLVAHGTPLFPPLPSTQIFLLPLENEDLLHRIHHRHGIGHLQDCCGPRTFKHTRACIHMHLGA